MLLDVEWTTDETSGDSLPEYKWLSAKTHTDKTGIPPSQWVAFQCLMGDATDGIKGAPGIGEKGAADIVKMFGTVEAAIAAAKTGDERLKPRQRESLIAFEPKAEVTRKLVTLVDSLEVPTTTRI
jgi:DNA polymerase-1